MATAKKLPSGNYRVRVSTGRKSSDGNYIYKSFTASTKRQAEILANEYLSKSSDPTSGTIAQLIRIYIDDKEAVLSPSTIYSYEMMYRAINSEFPQFALIKGDKLDSIALQRFINVLAQKRNPKTVANYHGLISSALKYSRCAMPIATLPSRQRPVLHTPDDSEIEALINGLRGTELEIPVMLAAFGAMRRGEIAGLTMDDIDGDVIHVHQVVVLNKDKKEVIKPYPKTDSSDRYVSLPHKVIEIINERGYITNLNLSQIYKRFSYYCRRHGFHFRFHDLRHYSASIMHAIGIPDQEIMRRGGWKTDSVMKRVYRNSLSDIAQAADSKINSHFDSLI